MQSELYLLSELGRLLNSPDKFKAEIQTQAVPNQIEIDILRYREKVRAHLLALQNSLTEQYSSKIAEFILFPVIANIDEKFLVFLTVSELNLKWETLQAEFYQRTDGGEYVFDILSEILSNKIYPKIVYEIMMMVMQYHFLGKYYDNPNHAERHQYIISLKSILEEFNSKLNFSEKIPKRVANSFPSQRKSYAIISGIIAIAIAAPIAIYLFI